VADAPTDGTVLAKGLDAGAFLVRSASGWPAGVKVQLVEGAAVVDAPGPAHQAVAGNIFAKLVAFTGAKPGRGTAGLPVAVVAGARDVYAPDVWWAREGRPDVAAGRLDSVPDLAVEVRSPATWRYDSGPKRRRYGVAGTAELWLVDPQAKKITVHRRTTAESTTFDDTEVVTAGELLVTPLLPGFSLDLAEVFRI
jgi:Uma2 family endonuclease